MTRFYEIPCESDSDAAFEKKIVRFICTSKFLIAGRRSDFFEFDLRINLSFSTFRIIYNMDSA